METAKSFHYENVISTLNKGLPSSLSEQAKLNERIAFLVQFRPTRHKLTKKSFEEHELKHGYEAAWIAHSPWRAMFHIPDYIGSLDAAFNLIEDKLPEFSYQLSSGYDYEHPDRKSKPWADIIAKRFIDSKKEPVPGVDRYSTQGDNMAIALVICVLTILKNRKT